jgi:two-component system, OmpR family, response regulator
MANAPRDNRSVQEVGEQTIGASTPARMTRPDGSPIEVLVVDDEPALGELVSMVLRYEGWNVATASNGATAIQKATADVPDMVVLDVMLPDMSGLQVLAELRAIRPDLPVLLLTAKDMLEDRIAGLSAGGDDYVTKPFSVEEMVLRLRALLRRTGSGVVASSSQLVVGDLVLDEDSHEVTRAGAKVSLTATEYEVLRYLMHNPRRVLTKSQILHQVWDYDFDGRSNVVELYISYLRKKIDLGRTPMIHTVRSVGYVLKPQ